MIFVAFLPDYITHPSHEKISDKPIWIVILQNTRPVLCNSVKAHEKQGRIEKVLQTVENQGHEVTICPGLDPVSDIAHLWKKVVKSE